MPGRSRLLVDGRLLPIGAARVAGTEFDFTEPRQLGTADAGHGVRRRGPRRRRRLGGDPVRAGRRRGCGSGPTTTFGWWQVFTSDTLTGERHRRAAAVEPMTCPPDAFRSGRDVITLEPGQTWRGTWGITPG